MKKIATFLALCIFISIIPSVPVQAGEVYLKGLADGAEYMDYDPMSDCIVYESSAVKKSSNRSFQTVGIKIARVIQPTKEFDEEKEKLPYFDNKTYVVLSIDDGGHNPRPNSELLDSHDDGGYESAAPGQLVKETFTWKVDIIINALDVYETTDGGMNELGGDYGLVKNWIVEIKDAYEHFKNNDPSLYPYGYWINTDSVMVWKTNGIRTPESSGISDVGFNNYVEYDNHPLPGLCDYSGDIYTYNAIENNTTLTAVNSKVLLPFKLIDGENDSRYINRKRQQDIDNPTRLLAPSDFYKAGPIPESKCPYDEHWERPLMIIPPIEPIPIEEEEVDDKEEDDEFVTYIGSRIGEEFGSRGVRDFKPYYKTYNYSPVFSLSSEVNEGVNPFEDGFENYYKGGIPSSEDVTNGIEVDEWYGGIGIGRHTAYKTYHFDLRPEGIKKSYSSTSHSWHTSSVKNTRVPYDITVAVTYYYIWDCSLYDFDSALVLNDCYTNDRLDYKSNTSTNYNLIKDNKLLKLQITTEREEDWKSNEKEHVEWYDVKTKKEVSKTSKHQSASTMWKKAKEECIAWAKKQVAGDIARVHNDRIEINGKVYLPDKIEILKDGQVTTPYSVVNPLDVPIEERQHEPVKIPDTVANGIYPTTFSAYYKLMVGRPNNKSIMEYTMEGDDAIKKLKPGNGVVNVTIGDIPG